MSSKTLAEILAELDETANSADHNNDHARAQPRPQSETQTRVQRQSPSQPQTQPQPHPDITAEQTSAQGLPIIQDQQPHPTGPINDPSHIQAAIDAQKAAIKADSRLRWLAFYYLSTREHSRAELKQKLLNKDQDPDKIDALLDEFADKGYQSEQRAAMMLIREGIRKGRGRRRIQQDFYQRQIDLPINIDQLIAMAHEQAAEFAEFIADDDDHVDWLILAVEARTKKYGDAIPTTPKDKAKQLRFLQYRGFANDICFTALKHNLDTLDDEH